MVDSAGKHDRTFTQRDRRGGSLLAKSSIDDLRRLYLDIPIHGQQSIVQVGPIDHARMLRSKLHYYTVAADRRSHQRLPVMGLSLFADDEQPSLALEPLIDAVREHSLNLTEIVNQADESGEILRQMVLQNLKILELLESINQGNLDAGHVILDKMYYGLMSSLSELATRLETTARQASNVEIAFETLTASDERIRRLYEDWAHQIHVLIDASRPITDMQARLAELMPQINEWQTERLAKMSLDNPVVAHALDFFQNNPSHTFQLEVFKWRRGGIARSDIEHTVAAAKPCLANLGDIRHEFLDSYQALSEVAQLLLKGLISYRVAMDNFSRACQAIVQIRRELPKDAVPPFEVVPDRVTQLQFAEALVLLRDREWAPRTLRDRIDGQISLIGDFLTAETAQVAYPDTYQALFDRVAADVEEIERELSAPPPSQPVVSLPCVQTLAVVSDRNVTAAVPSERLQLIYEQLICVGYVLTGQNSNPMHSSSINSLLLTLALIPGYLPEDDLEGLRKAIEPYFRACGESIVIKYDEVKKQLVKNPVRWLIYQRKRMAGQAYKLTNRGGRGVAALMTKHGLTSEMIRTAQRQKQLTYQANRANYRETENQTH